MKKITVSTIAVAVGLTVVTPMASEAASSVKLNKKNVLVHAKSEKVVKGYKVYTVGEFYKNKNNS